MALAMSSFYVHVAMSLGGEFIRMFDDGRGILIMGVCWLVGKRMR